MLERARSIVGQPFTGALEEEKVRVVNHTDSSLKNWQCMDSLNHLSRSQEWRWDFFFFLRKDLLRNRLSNEVKYTEDHENSIPAETLPAWNARERDRMK